MSDRARRLIHGRRSSEPFVLWGASRSELIDRVGALRRFVARHPDVALSSLAEAVNRVRPPRGARRLGAVASDLPDLERKLSCAESRLHETSVTRIADRDGMWFSERPLADRGSVAAVF